MPIAITEEQRALRESVRRWAAGAGTLVTVRAMEETPAAWERHWAGVAGLGVFAIALPEPCGGAGGTAADLASAVEALAEALVPGPVLPTLVAALALADHADLPAAKEALPALASGGATVALCLTPGGFVLGAGASHVLLPGFLPGDSGWYLLDARVTPRTAVDFSRPIGVVEAGVLPAERRLPLTTARVKDIAALVAAVESTAVASWATRTAAEYAKVRQQFGRPIGAFQAVQHMCAEMLCRAERATALVWDAARAFDEAPEEFPLAVAAAAAVALDAGVDNAKDCVQVLGGIGFTWEHDAHLYLRRAVALRQFLGGGAAWRARAAELAVAGARRTLSIGDTSAPPEVRVRVAGIAALPEGERRVALADAGYLAPQWPAPYGLGAGPAEQLALDAELDRAGVTRPDIAIAGWAVPTILSHGTEAQRERFAGPSLRGEITWCQLFSEPEAGSDLASLRMRAEAAPGGWRLTGQKVWTSLAADADWGICLARTDPDAPKHKGLTYFLVPMRSPGVEVRPLRELTGRAVFNEVFLDGVFVPDDCVVGQPGDGWRLARGTLAYERVAMSRGSSFGEGVERLVAAGAPAELLGGLVAGGLAVSLLDVRAALRRLDGQPGGPESAVAKLVGVAHRQAVAEAALVCLGEAGAAADGDGAEAVHEFLLSRCLSIAGGTTQILLSVVAQRVLGLPREGR
ncbi:acyl-CoA dehydrogenase [Phytohabitans aurantiacus]|uniref:Acyl-CoA dehydrogenase n=1 Tax=Phytohabitans aurantiacus TaxID=3016789 RepID=A0ABQ5QY79_9ACTN|nr:acyl-CoA dehydrogenase [Phytohabitans aurantiacus]GLH99493.1 acyl-CoA dehydrogenase [Phytohabitans aurantiacus]